MLQGGYCIKLFDGLMCLVAVRLFWDYVLVAGNELKIQEMNYEVHRG